MDAYERFLSHALVSDHDWREQPREMADPDHLAQTRDRIAARWLRAEGAKARAHVSSLTFAAQLAPKVERIRPLKWGVR